MCIHNKKIFLKISGIILLLSISIFFSVNYSNYAKIRSTQFGWFRDEVTGLLLNYQFHYLHPPESIDSFINYLECINFEHSSKNVSTLISTLNHYKSDMFFSNSIDSNYLFLCYTGFNTHKDKMYSKIVDIDTLNFIEIFLNNYNIALSYYEIPNLCTDNLYRVYVNDTVYINDYADYDSLINLEIKPIIKKYLSDLYRDNYFEFVIIINLQNRKVKIKNCESNLSNIEMMHLNEYLQKQISQLDLGQIPDSILIPIRFGYRQTNLHK